MFKNLLHNLCSVSLDSTQKNSFQSHPFFKSVDFSDGDGEETAGGLAVV